jgi:hypothetical protein
MGPFAGSTADWTFNLPPVPMHPRQRAPRPTGRSSKRRRRSSLNASDDEAGKPHGPRTRTGCTNHLRKAQISGLGQLVIVVGRHTKALALPLICLDSSSDPCHCEFSAVIAGHTFGRRYSAAARADSMHVSISHGLSPCQSRKIMMEGPLRRIEPFGPVLTTSAHIG